MKTAFSHSKRRLSAACRIVVLAGIAASVGTSAHAINYDESVSGDLSSDAKHPTTLGALTLGDNFIVGATIPSGPIVDPRTGARAVEDNDYVSFSVAPGELLSQIVLGDGSVFQPRDRMFFGIAQGTEVDVDSSFTSAAGLLGWTLVGSPQVGTNVQPALGLSKPANFPPIGGATGFSGPLPAGTYTLWMVDGDQPALYSLDLVVAEVPEAATWMTMLAGLGLVGATRRRRAQGRSAATA